MGQAFSWSYRITLAPLASNVDVARGLIRDCLLEHNLWFLVEDVRLVASELATNALLHAGTPFVVELEGSADQVRLSVSDSSELEPVEGTASYLSTGGRGLTIVDAVSSDWGVVNDRRRPKAVWALFDVESGASPGAGEQGTSVSSLPPRGTGR